MQSIKLSKATQISPANKGQREFRGSYAYYMACSIPDIFSGGGYLRCYMFVSTIKSQTVTYDSPVQARLLKQQLSDFMGEARQNERKLRRFQSMELRLVGLNSLLELIEVLVHPEASCVGWDMVSLLLIDPEYEVQRMLTDEGVAEGGLPELTLVANWEQQESFYSTSLFPVLSSYRPNKHSTLFANSRRPASVALLPLVRYGRLIGSLNIGSFKRDRFVRGVRTDFLEHYAAVVAICIENGINLERLKRQGLTDTLTAINNRRFFDQRLSEEMERVERSGEPLSAMLLDVDLFKSINDTYGHQVGDEVLREVAALIRTQLRGSDVLSRYGGEEFAALLAKTGSEEAEEVAERVRQSIEARQFEVAGHEAFSVTISIGVVTLRVEPKEGNESLPTDLLIGYADKALYRAKETGRNRVVSGGEINMAAS